MTVRAQATTASPCRRCSCMPSLGDVDGVLAGGGALAEDRLRFAKGGHDRGEFAAVLLHAGAQTLDLADFRADEAEPFARHTASEDGNHGPLSRSSGGDAGPGGGSWRGGPHEGKLIRWPPEVKRGQLQRPRTLDQDVQDDG